MSNNNVNPTAEKKVGDRFIHIAIFIYWALLVVWQNIGETATGSTIDTALKMVLLVFLTASYFICVRNPQINIIRLILLVAFVLTQVVTLFFEPNLGLRIIVSYVFPALFLFLSFVYGNNVKITKKQYVVFLNCVIAVVAYSALYAIIFMPEQFLGAFSISNAYGNELSSFFVSNHEYGMYLFAGIAACIFCLDIKKDKPFYHKIIYIVCLVLFLPNIVLTFSRTSMLATAIFLVVYVLFIGKSRMKILLLIVAFVALAAFAFSSTIRDFVLNIVLKENNMAGREDLFNLAIEYFNEADLLGQIFGRGIEESRAYFVAHTDHGSVHNAYLQVLTYYGVAGLLFMIGFMASRFVAAFKLVKKDRFIGVFSIGLLIACALMMVSNTSVIFNSPIDSFFITAFAIVIPKYLENGIIDEMEQDK